MSSIQGPLQPTTTAPDTVPPGVLTPEPSPEQRRGFWRRPEHPVATPLYLLVLAFCTVLFIYPFVWLLSASFKPRAEVFDNKLIPSTFNPSNYLDVFRGVATVGYHPPFAHWFVNSVYIALLAAIAVTVTSALVAFGFAYFRFPGRNFLFGCVLATMMLPGAVMMIPRFLIWRHLGLASSQVPLWAGNLFGSAFYIFLMRQFFLGIPRELFEAARMDGDSFLSMFRRIAVPIARPALIVTLVLEFKSSWTNLMDALIYLRHDAQFTLPRGLYVMIGVFGPSGGGEGDYQVVMAALVLSTLPLILLFFLGQRYFMEGIATQGRKG